MRLGLVVNPVAGMGGRVGLKGTDGKAEAARERGAEPRAPDRAVEAMESFAERQPDAEILAGAGRMGAKAARSAGFEPTVVGDVDPQATAEPASTSADDTRAVVRAFGEQGVDLVLFAGGDGTAVDVAGTLDAMEEDADRDGEDDDGPIPMLGIPAGVKVYSSVFAVTPREAGRIAAEFDRVEDREINDIDEAAYREGTVTTELRAVRPVPVAEGLQASKQLGGGSIEGLVEGVLADLQPGTTYVLGPGSTVVAIEDALGIDGSPLGVDVWLSPAAFDGVPSRENPPDGEVVVRDGSADEIREVTIRGDAGDPSGAEGDVVVIVSPIGGQGFLFGRGNQQIAPDVVDAAEIVVVASRAKLDGLGTLHVDTDDGELNETLRGWRRVRIGRVEHRMLPVE